MVLSPNFPLNYTTRQTCSYYISVSPQFGECQHGASMHPMETSGEGGNNCFMFGFLFLSGLWSVCGFPNGDERLGGAV